MHSLIFLSLVVSIAAAGYNYNQVQSQPTHHHQQQYYTGLIHKGSEIASPSIQQHATEAIVTPIQPQPQPQPQPQTQPQPQHYEEVNKEFYTYTAPEEEFTVPQQEHQTSSVKRKNLQVIFIHAPEQQGLNRAVQNLAQQTLEQQTAIYVLTKQADLSQLSHSLQRESNQISHKPEVHFVKYRTPEDAARAQQSIRAQYDALGGSSSSSDESVAPVINFASQSSHQQGHEHPVEQRNGASNAHLPVPIQTYLPSRF